MSKHGNRREWLLRAGRTFLQTACGMLTAVIAASVTGTVQAENWKLALLTLLASTVAAGIAALMNQTR